MTEGTPLYGERPLAQTVAAAGAMRRLTGLLLSLEHEHPTVDAMLGQLSKNKKKQWVWRGSDQSSDYCC